jgi:hypothetical protein
MVWSFNQAAVLAGSLQDFSLPNDAREEYDTAAADLAPDGRRSESLWGEDRVAVLAHLIHHSFFLTDLREELEDSDDPRVSLGDDELLASYTYADWCLDFVGEFEDGSWRVWTFYPSDGRNCFMVARRGDQSTVVDLSLH